MNKIDYSDIFIDTSNRKRLYFFIELSKILERYRSTSQDVNDLIWKLYTICNRNIKNESKRINIDYCFDLKEDKKIDNNTFIRNVWDGDMVIYSIVSSICENKPWGISDTLLDIINEIYILLYNIIFPDYREGLDYNNIRYYVEVEYINSEKQKELKEKYNIDFVKENWRA